MHNGRLAKIRLVMKWSISTWLTVGLLMIIGWNNERRVMGSPFWSLMNQMKIEKRPYTKPSDVAAGVVGPTFMSTANKLLQPTLREMHRYCDGQCFYAGSDSSGGTCNLEKYECELTASIAMHNEDLNGELYCDIFGPDNLRESFCRSSQAQENYRKSTSKASDIFYTVTLHRILGSPDTWGIKDVFEIPLSSCRKKWDDKTGRRCRKTEFVAIAFVDAAAATTPKLHPEDLWYVCIADETSRSRVSMWTGISDPPGTPVRIVNTKPHNTAGMGVVFSKLLFVADMTSMGCQFVIQESNMTIDKPPAHAAFFGQGQNIKVKLASGYVQRNEKNDEVLTPFYTGYSSSGVYKLFMESDVKPSNQLDFSKLKVELEVDPSSTQDSIDTNKKNRQDIRNILKRCDNPSLFPDWYIACYPPKNQLNCVHTGRCPFMFIVEVPRSHKAFNTFTGHIYSFLPDDNSLRKTSRRPLGFASVAFSFDGLMGRDVVVTCHANGMSDMRVNVSINFGKTNIYPGKVSYQKLISEEKAIGSAESNQILCSFKMKTSFVVNMFTYEPDYRHVIRTGDSEKLEFNLQKDEVFLLAAAGNRNYPNGKIVYHDFRQTLQERFNKALFFKKASACKNGIQNNVLFLVWGFLFLSYNFFI